MNWRSAAIDQFLEGQVDQLLDGLVDQLNIRSIVLGRKKFAE